MYLNTWNLNAIIFYLEEGIFVLFLLFFFKHKWSWKEGMYDDQCSTDSAQFCVEFNCWCPALLRIDSLLLFWLLSSQPLLLFGQEDIICQDFIPPPATWFLQNAFKLDFVENLQKSSGLCQLDFIHPDFILLILSNSLSRSVRC